MKETSIKTSEVETIIPRIEQAHVSKNQSELFSVAQVTDVRGAAKVWYTQMLDAEVYPQTGTLFLHLSVPSSTSWKGNYEQYDCGVKYGPIDHANLLRYSGHQKLTAGMSSHLNLNSRNYLHCVFHIGPAWHQLSMQILYLRDC